MQNNRHKYRLACGVIRLKTLRFNYARARVRVRVFVLARLARWGLSK